MATLYSAPSLVGVMRESADYQVMGAGFTDRIFLLGHGDGIGLNDPYELLGVQDCVNRLNADIDSPLLRGMLEVYYGGARDVWIVAAAPMGEYVPPEEDRLAPGAGRGDVDWDMLEIPAAYQLANAMRAERGASALPVPTEAEWFVYNFYERYKARLDIAYEMIMGWELPQLILPLEALFYDTGGVDFLTQLSTHCAEALELTGSIRMGFLGTRVDFDTIPVATAIADMTTDFRLNQGVNGRFVSVVVGEGTVSLKEFPLMYSSPIVNAAVGSLAHFPLELGWTYRHIPNVLNVVGPDLTAAQVATLAEVKLNPAVRTNRGRRGSAFETVVATDNTLGPSGTDFWSMGQVRLVMHIIEKVRALSKRYIGTIEFSEYKRAVETYLANLTLSETIRSYKTNIYKNPDNGNEVFVEINVLPFFGLRQITFITRVGPGL